MGTYWFRFWVDVVAGVLLWFSYRVPPDLGRPLIGLYRQALNVASLGISKQRTCTCGTLFESAIDYAAHREVAH